MSASSMPESNLPPGEDWGEELLEAARRDLRENTEPRCPCILLLDNSGSMAGLPIAALNEAVAAFRADVLRDAQASKRVEVAVVTFGGEVTVLQDFVTVDKFVPPTLQADGQTPMGAAILCALDLLQRRKYLYKQEATHYYRPWMILITDGMPEGEPAHLFEQAVQRVRDAEQGDAVLFYAVGVKGADMSELAKLTPPSRPPAQLRELRFRELFAWLANSMQAVSHSRKGDKIKLPSPSEWQEVEV
jgi:uncharacterized protein YegL